MGVVIKGRRVQGGPAFANHIADTKPGKPKTNEAVTLLTSNGLASKTIHGMTREIELEGGGAKSKRKVASFIISPDPKDRPWAAEDYLQAAQILMRRSGHEGQPYYLVVHDKPRQMADCTKGVGPHAHLVCGNIKDGEAIHDSNSYVMHEEASREIEQALGLQVGRGAFTGRPRGKDGHFLDERPLGALNEREKAQADRTKIKSSDIAGRVQRAWKISDNGAGFLAALDNAGLVLARGDKPGMLLVVDEAGGIHGLRRRLKGEAAASIDAKLADLDRSTLPTAENAKNEQKNRLHTGLQNPACSPSAQHTESLAPGGTKPDVDTARRDLKMAEKLAKLTGGKGGGFGNFGQSSIGSIHGAEIAQAMREIMALQQDLSHTRQPIRQAMIKAAIANLKSKLKRLQEAERSEQDAQKLATKSEKEKG